MGRYRKNPAANRVRVNLTLDPDVYEKVQELCYGAGMSVSEMVVQQLQRKLDEERRFERGRKQD